METENNITLEEIKKSAMQILSLCRKCKHNDVCKYLQEREGQAEPCKDFLNAGDYKTYGNIYSFFQPIFDWLNCHYPSGDVRFVVDNTSAKMYLEHGPFVASEELKSASFYSPNKDKMQSESDCEKVASPENIKGGDKNDLL